MFVNKLYCNVIVWAYIFLGEGLKIYNMQSFVINLIYNYNRNNGSKRDSKQVQVVCSIQTASEVIVWHTSINEPGKVQYFACVYGCVHHFFVLPMSCICVSHSLSWLAYQRIVALLLVRNVLEQGNVMFFNTLKELARLWLWTLREERCLSGKLQALCLKCG